MNMSAGTDLSTFVRAVAQTLVPAAAAAALVLSCGGAGGAGPTVDVTAVDTGDLVGDAAGELVLPPDGGAPDGRIPDATLPDVVAADGESELPSGPDAADLQPPPDGSEPDAAGDSLADSGGDSSTGDAGPDLPSGETEEDVPSVPEICTSDADCAPWALVCDPLSGTCVECLFSTPHCPAGWICEDFACKETTVCGGDEECAAFETEPFCDPVTGLCVACFEDLQCPEANKCVDAVCQPYTPCESSKQCGDEELCWLDEGMCVECVLPEDCAAGEECSKDHTCEPVTACTSDKQCTPLGMVCDFEAGLCRQCVVHGDCPAEYHCLGNECILDSCLAGSARCEAGGIEVCNDVGDGYLPVVPCEAEQTCVESFPEAVCTDWICPAGQSWCDEPAAPETAVTCAVDGLSIAATIPCQETGQVCLGGACLDVICPPAAVTCDPTGFSLVTCVEKGTKQVEEACGPGKFCKLGTEKGTASCEVQVCPPDQAVCVGNVASTCNSNGSDVLPGGTDCTALQQQCYKGACTVCEAAEKCDGIDNTCNGVVDESPADCGSPNVCHVGACYKPTNQYLCKVALYGGHVYQHCLGQSANWNEAQAACQAWYGSSLISLADKPEHNFLMSLTGQVVWVGYTDGAQEGAWTWLDGGTEFTYFCNGQPDNWQSNEDCAAANFYSGNEGKKGCFNDYSCTTKLTEYICEKP